MSFDCLNCNIIIFQLSKVSKLKIFFIIHYSNVEAVNISYILNVDTANLSSFENRKFQDSIFIFKIQAENMIFYSSVIE